MLGLKYGHVWLWLDNVLPSEAEVVVAVASVRTYISILFYVCSGSSKQRNIDPHRPWLVRINRFLKRIKKQSQKNPRYHHLPESVLG